MVNTAIIRLRMFILFITSSVLVILYFIQRMELNLRKRFSFRRILARQLQTALPKVTAQTELTDSGTPGQGLGCVDVSIIKK